MIVDAPYDFGDLLIRPRMGFAAGVGASIVMLGAMAGLHALGGSAPVEWLDAIARPILPGNGAQIEWANLLLGLVIHLLVGGMLGMLYALCQQRAPNRGLVAVGIFYAVTLWVFGGWIMVWWSGTEKWNLRSWPEFVTMLAYGLVLTFWAITEGRRRATMVPAQRPVD